MKDFLKSTTQEVGIDSLTVLLGMEGNKSGENKEVALKTGTDDLPIKTVKSTYKPTYKKLAKKYLL